MSYIPTAFEGPSAPEIANWSDFRLIGSPPIERVSSLSIAENE